MLRRDVEAADQALATAERAGRASMRELRATLTVLREGDEVDTSSLPGAADIAPLVDQARLDGLRVALKLSGDAAGIGDAPGLALYGIAQEAVANALHHARSAETLVALDTCDGAARHTVLSHRCASGRGVPPSHEVC